MVLIEIPILIIFFCGIKFSASQGHTYLTEPWVDTVPTPEVAPVILAINSSCVTPGPNIFNRYLSASLQEPVMMFNTGKSLSLQIASPTSPNTSYTMGGALGLGEYKFNYLVFLWDLNLGNAGITVDGVGSPLQVVLFHSNLDYGPRDASNYLDGWFIQIHRVKIVDGAPDNDVFSTFGEKINEITEPGTNVTFTREDLGWLMPAAVRLHEYCYPGSVSNPRTKQVTNSATACITLDQDMATISQSQFLDIFGSLLNESNEPFVNVRPPQNVNPNTKIGLFGPAILSLQPIDTVPTPEVAPVILSINSSFVTPVPNTFNRYVSASLEEPLIMFNTGRSLYIQNSSPTSPYTSCTMGGALGLNEYKVDSLIFLWNLNLENAGITVDGVGSPLQVVIFHSNRDYGPRDTSNYLDGWFVQIHRVKTVDGVLDNDDFATFGEKVNEITKLGTNVTFTREDLGWFLPATVRMQEYCYPGSVSNPITKQVTNSAIVCITLDQDLTTVSQSQFLDIFGSLLNESNEPFSNVRSPQNVSPDTKIGLFGPAILTLQADSEQNCALQPSENVNSCTKNTEIYD